MGSHTVKPPSVADVQLPSGSIWAKLPLIGGVVGVAGLGGAFALGMGSQEFWFSYLVAFLYWLSLALGALFFVIIQFAARAGWSVAVRRVAENMMATLPLFALLFIPILLGMDSIFHHWLHPHGSPVEIAIVKGKEPYLNRTFFIIRAVIYFVAWCGLALFYYRNSVRQDQTGNREHTAKMIYWAGPAIAIFGLTVTFAAFDWIMSIDPHWFSTMYGVYYFAGCAVGLFAMLSLLVLGLRKSGAFAGTVTKEHQHDLGKLTFGFTVFWTYIAFSQYFLIWYASIPEETLWYKHHLHGNWYDVAVFLVVGHFAVPFFFLMSRHIKRNGLGLALGAGWMLLMHFVDLHWQIRPLVGPDAHFHITASDILTFVGIGGLFFAAFGYFLKRQAVVPVKDPYVEESLAFDTGV